MGEGLVMFRVTFAVLVLLFSLPCASASAQAEGSLDEEARGIFMAGRAAFDDGRWQEALDYFQRAYELSSRPGLLYNIGQTADRMRQDDVALEAFERYLELMPEAPNRSAVEARLAVLRRAVSEAADEQRPSPEQDPAPAVQGPVVAPESPADTPAPVGPIVVLSAGVASAAAGGVLLLMANGASNTVTDASEGTPWVDVESDYDSSGTLGVSGAVLLGAGVALAASGAIWLALWDSGDDSVEVAISPTGAVLRGTF